jgi:hypothetical protein
MYTTITTIDGSGATALIYFGLVKESRLIINTPQGKEYRQMILLLSEFYQTSLVII